MHTNGFGFNQLVAYRAFKKPLQVGDSFSLLIEQHPFQKNLGKDDSIPGSVGFALRTSGANILGDISRLGENEKTEKREGAIEWLHSLEF
jgi:hypothetical protein